MMGSGKNIITNADSSSNLKSKNISTQENLPWVEKYRPKKLEDLVSHTDIISTITRFIVENRLPHLLFYGPPGTGKTSTILACAKKLYSEKSMKSMVLELNASDERGIDVVRDQIKNFASSRTMFSSGFKLIILDEADAMTQAAQNALRRVIEKYTKNVRFCIICNYVGKIIPALQSRCTRFRFAPLQSNQIEKRLDWIVGQENFELTEDGRKALLKLSQGDMRKVLNILQASHAAFNTVDEDAVYKCTGSPLPVDITRMLDWLLNSEYSFALSNIQKLKTEKGYALIDILSEISNMIASMDIPSNVRVYVLEQLAEIEINLSSGCSETLQLGGLVGSFRLAIELSTKQ